MERLIAFMAHYEPIWLFVVLVVETVSGYLSVMMLAKRLSERKTYTRRKRNEEFENLTIGESK